MECNIVAIMKKAWRLTSDGELWQAIYLLGYMHMLVRSFLDVWRYYLSN
jgi:hypothetical protein